MIFKSAMLALLGAAAVVFVCRGVCLSSESCVGGGCAGGQCVGGFCPLPAGPAISRPVVPVNRPVSRPMACVVRVASPENGATSLGSGALVWVSKEKDRAVILTAWHIFRGASGPPVITFPDGSRFAGRVVKTSALWDLAAVAIRRPKAAAIAIASRIPRAGDVLSVAGYGSGNYRIIRGRVRQFLTPGQSSPAQMVDIAAQSRNGDSGGPIIDSDGCLAAVVSGGDANSVVGTHAARIRDFLRGVVPAGGVGSQTMPSDGDNIEPKTPGSGEGMPAPLLDAPLFNADADETTAGPAIGNDVDNESVKNPLPEAVVSAIAEAAGPSLYSSVWPYLVGALGGSVPAAGAAWLALFFGRKVIKSRKVQAEKRLRGLPNIGVDVPMPTVQEPERQVGGGEAHGFCGLPRDNTEAIQLLRLSQLEGRDSVHDAIVGRLTYDEIQNIIDAGDERAEWAAGLRRKLEERFNQLVPLALYTQKKEV